MSNSNEQNYIVDAILRDGTMLKIHKEMFNEVYLPYFYCQDRIQIYMGGGSSGKSTFIFNTVPINVLLFNRNYLILQKELKQSKSSCLNEIKKSLAKFGLEQYFEFKQQPKFTFTCKLNGCQIVFDGLEDVENLKSTVPVVGSWTDIIVEEATNITENDFDQLMIRQRGTCYDDNGDEISKRIYVVFNPISKSHWLYKRFFRGKWIESKDKAIKYNEYIKLDDYGTVEKITTSILKTTYKDNKFLTKQDISSLLNTKDKNRYNIYVLGNFGSLGKTIFNVNEHYEVVDNLREQINQKQGFIRMGLDFGGGVAPFAYVKCKIDKRKKEIYIYDEFSIVDITIPDLCRFIKPKSRGNGYIHVEQGNDMRLQLKKHGCVIKGARKGQKSIVAGLNFLKEYHIFIDSRCKAIISNFELYSWKKNRMGEYIEIPEDVNNDSIDALRYALSYDFIRGSNKTKFVKERIA